MSDDYGEESDEENQTLIINSSNPELARYPSGRYYEEPEPYESSTSPFSRRRVPVDYGTYRGPRDDISASLSRYKYYNKLAPYSETSLQMPDHVVPDPFLIHIFLPTRQSTQSSVITVFALWNTMVGTSLLSMPWAVQQSGFATGIVILLCMSILMFYTSYRILKSVDSIDANTIVVEFSDICRHYLGKWAEMSSLVFSLITLLGGAIVYWILMSNFLYNIVTFIYVHVNHEITPRFDIINTTTGNVYCPSGSAHSIVPMNNITPPNVTYPTTISPPDPDHSIFWQIWHLQRTVPFFLIIIILPLVNFKSPTFFTKFNSLGTISVVFLMTFVTIKAVKWGINIDFTDTKSGLYAHEFRPTFPSISGIAALALFIHNCVLSIMRNKKTQAHNTRDLGLAYLCVTLTYLYISVTFYVTFPADKTCIEDNFLNNILATDILAFTARVFLLIQMIAVFPLLLYIFRVQLLNTLFGSVWPSWKHVVILNLIIIVICIIFARFLPHIGKIIGFVGAFCGLAYAMFLPCVVYMLSLRQRGLLSILVVLVHTTIILVGFLNFIGQFVVLGISKH